MKKQRSLLKFYDEMRIRNKYGGELPFVVNPHKLSKAEINFYVNSKVRTVQNSEIVD